MKMQTLVKERTPREKWYWKEDELNAGDVQKGEAKHNDHVEMRVGSSQHERLKNEGQESRSTK